MSAPPVEVLSFGCRLNIVESEVMRAAAEAGGARDTVIVNTCAVTAEAVRQGRQAIRRVKRERPASRVVVTGCASELEPSRFRAMPEVDRLVGNLRKTAPETWGDGPGAILPKVAAHTRGFVEIQNGCDHRCTFCVIPFGRGTSRAVSPDQVVQAVRLATEAGARDVVLTGVDVTSYRWGEMGLGAVIKHVLGAVPDLERLRLSSIDCIEADADLLDVVTTEPRFMPHLHVSLQSGADLILKRMKRRHARRDAVRFCDDLRRRRPDIIFGADLIVGFPTETEAHFVDTLALVEDCGLTHLHVFPYSARPGTPAARMPAVDGLVVKARAARLRAAGAAALSRHLDRQVGRRLRVLTERGGRARTEDFTPVRLDDEPNRMVEIDIVAHDGRELHPVPVTRQAASPQGGRLQL